MERFKQTVVILIDGLAELLRILRTRIRAVHEKGLLTQNLVETVTGKIQKRLIGKDDRITGQIGIGHRHGHSRGTDGFNEDAAPQAHLLDRSFNVRSCGSGRHFRLESVHCRIVGGHVVHQTDLRQGGDTYACRWLSIMIALYAVSPAHRLCWLKYPRIRAF